MKRKHNPPVAGLITFVLLPVCVQNVLLAQEAQAPPLTEQGQVMVAGRSTPYLIRHLPISSFPQLPAGIADALNQKGCTIPQTYAAHAPENVIHASFERPGSSDWAVLCSVRGTVSLLVFFDGGAESAEPPTVLAAVEEKDRLQAHPGSAVLGFNWGIDPASPQQVHEAQSGMQNRPARIDHDAVADSDVDHYTIYHFYSKKHWLLLNTAD